uniref:Uncharacterized protein n=1 Tax=Amphimedon queenslandica TaxID=400682 RepID=A0A1X7UFC5_AMPQE
MLLLSQTLKQSEEDLSAIIMTLVKTMRNQAVNVLVIMMMKISY